MYKVIQDIEVSFHSGLMKAARPKRSLYWVNSKDIVINYNSFEEIIVQKWIFILLIMIGAFICNKEFVFVFEVQIAYKVLDKSGLRPNLTKLNGFDLYMADFSPFFFFFFLSIGQFLWLPV